MSMCLRMLGCLAAGLGLGVLLRLRGLSFDSGALQLPLLTVLLVAVGMETGALLRKTGVSFLLGALRHASVAIAGTLLGTLGGGLLAGWLLGLAVHKALALAAGFGWYTLSSVMLAGLDSPVLGASAFLCNVFRELIAIVLIPFLAKAPRGKPAAISLAGATSMDTTLPLLTECGGPETGASAFVHGLAFSFLVPVLVPFVYGLT